MRSLICIQNTQVALLRLRGVEADWSSMLEPGTGVKQVNINSSKNHKFAWLYNFLQRPHAANKEIDLDECPNDRAEIRRCMKSCFVKIFAHEVRLEND